MQISVVKRQAILTGSLMVLVACHQDEGSQPPAAASPGPYAVKQAVVDFDLSGAEPGTERLYFTDFGRRQARLRTVTLNTEHGPQVAHTLIIEDGRSRYLIDMDAKRGTRTALPKDSLPPAERRAAAQSLWEKLGAESRGTGEVAGRACEIWASPATGTTICIWQGLRLQTLIQSDGMISRVAARSIDENAVIPDTQFTPPEDISIQEQKGERFP